LRDKRVFEPAHRINAYTTHLAAALVNVGRHKIVNEIAGEIRLVLAGTAAARNQETKE